MSIDGYNEYNEHISKVQLGRIVDTKYSWIRTEDIKYFLIRYNKSDNWWNNKTLCNNL